MEQRTIAEKWLQKIDKPNGDISKQSVEQMQGAAVTVGDKGMDYVYVFSDGSGLYEKRRDEWYPLEGCCTSCGDVNPDDCGCDPHPEDDVIESHEAEV